MVLMGMPIVTNIFFLSISLKESFQYVPKTTMVVTVTDDLLFK